MELIETEFINKEWVSNYLFGILNGETFVSELAKENNTSESVAYRQLEKLVKLGLVKKVKYHLYNARLYKLTERGIDIIERLMIIDKIIERHNDRFDEEAIINEKIATHKIKV